MAQLPDKPTALGSHDEAQLREWAIAVGRSEDRPGWPDVTIARIGTMSKRELIDFLLRNYYKPTGH